MRDTAKFVLFDARDGDDGGGGDGGGHDDGAWEESEVKEEEEEGDDEDVEVFKDEATVFAIKLISEMNEANEMSNTERLCSFWRLMCPTSPHRRSLPGTMDPGSSAGLHPRLHR